MAALTLSHRETWTLLGISRAAFYRALKTGALDRLRAPYPAHHKFSRAKVEAFIDGPPSFLQQPRGLRAAS